MNYLTRVFNQVATINDTSLQSDIMHIRQLILDLQEEITRNVFLRKEVECRFPEGRTKTQTLQKTLLDIVYDQNISNEVRLTELTKTLRIMRDYLWQEVVSRDLYIKTHKPTPDKMQTHLIEALLIKLGRRDINPVDGISILLECRTEVSNMPRCEVKQLLRVSESELCDLETLDNPDMAHPMKDFSISQVIELIIQLSNKVIKLSTCTKKAQQPINNIVKDKRLEKCCNHTRKSNVYDALMQQ